MNNKSVFNFFCKRDIENIYEIISPHLPEFDIKNLNQSIIYEEHKKIVCRVIKNKNRDIIGKELIIQLYDTNEVYRLKDKDNCIKFEKCYNNEKEKVKIVLDDYVIKRLFTYKKGEIEDNLYEEYDLNSKSDLFDYINSDSVEDIFEIIKVKNKVRKRD